MDKKPEASHKQKAESTTDQLLAAGKVAIEKAQEAVEKVQQEGSKLFGSVTKEGEKVRSQTQKLAEETLGEAKEKLEEIREKAANTFDNLEKIFEDRVSRVLSRMGIPTSDDFRAIAERLDALNKNVKELIKAQKSEAKTSAAHAQEKDDLKAISGVGPALESKLNADGILSYRQVATLTAEEIERIETEVIHSSGRITRDNWIAQARELHFKKYNEKL